MSLIVVPAVDMMGGLVVAARGGERAAYRALDSALCRSPEPHAVIDGLLEHHPFPVIYLADLDAIRGRGNHAIVIQELRQRHPAVEFWVDAGIRDGRDLARFRASDLGTPVIGTESLVRPALLDDMKPGAEAVLSLDYQGRTLLGRGPSPARWPRRVIVMMLDRVGSGTGPDRALLANVRRAAGRREVFAAGGAGTVGDLEALARDGMQG
ncbi:MAG: hypothetical protein GWO02_14500, partial [Gammaproteobacteria bacterium]|nr:hypothetical protein [Gammaproteobacteria bacterium]